MLDSQLVEGGAGSLQIAAAALGDPGNQQRMRIVRHGAQNFIRLLLGELRVYFEQPGSVVKSGRHRACRFGPRVDPCCDIGRSHSEIISRIAPKTIETV